MPVWYQPENRAMKKPFSSPSDVNRITRLEAFGASLSVAPVRYAVDPCVATVTQG